MEEYVEKLMMARSAVTLFFASFACVFASACGYTLQTSKSELVDREGIRKIYVRPVKNKTLKLGVENLVYNALLRNIAANGNVKLVQSEADADARLESVIWEVQSTISSSVAAGSDPVNFYPGLQVASEYSAQLVCQFSLYKEADRKGPTRLIWSLHFTRSKLFPAFVQIGVPGTTSPLITESEFYRTIGDIASSMMDDVHESMFSMF